MVTKTPPPPHPWETIAEDGSNLAVEDFLTVPIVRLAAYMRRFPAAYAEPFGLTLPEWRLLSTLDFHQTIPFGRLVSISSTDKALVSRTVQALEKRGLLKRLADPGGHRKKVECAITPAGHQLVETIMPIARRRQAMLLNQLGRQDRVRLHGLLKKLERICEDTPCDLPIDELPPV